jgi:hypothetical protein
MRTKRHPPQLHNPTRSIAEGLWGWNGSQVWLYDFVWLFVVDFVKIFTNRLMEARTLADVTGTAVPTSLDPTRPSMVSGR